jgi:molecular chaperone GrpE
MTGGDGRNDDGEEREAARERPSGFRSHEAAAEDGRGRCSDEEIVADELAESEEQANEHGVVEIIGGDAPDLNTVTAALAQRDEYLDSLRRLQAEFENYKKRVSKQQADQAARAAVSLVEKILPVLDTLDLAIEHMGDPGSVDGRALEAVYSQLREVLGREGLERISPIGERFDPTAHDAVGHLEADAGPEAGDEAGGEAAAGGSAGGPREDGEPVVDQVMRAGYRWKGAVLRPAMVMVRG